MSTKYLKTNNDLLEISYYDLKNWKMIGLFSNKDEVDIVLRNDEYFKLLTTMKDFIMSLQDKDFFINSFKCDYIYMTKIVYCNLCGGTGYIDWISKAMQSSNKRLDRKNYLKSKDRERECKRNYEGNLKVKELIPIISANRLFIRTPVIKLGNEMCTGCCGSGLSIGKFIKSIDDPSPFLTKLK
jgi:hypothetical protein